MTQKVAYKPRDVFRDLCKVPHMRDIYSGLISRLQVGGHISDYFQQAVVYTTLSLFEKLVQRDLFETQRGNYQLGEVLLPSAYRFRKEVRIRAATEDGDEVVLEKGHEKGDFIPVSEIYQWLSEV